MMAIAKRYTKARVCVFIDGLNVMHRLRECGWEEFFDVEHLAERIARNRELTGVFFFRASPLVQVVGPKRYWREKQYMAKVEQQLFDVHGRYVRYGTMVPRKNKWNEKQSDVWLASEMIAQAYRDLYDVAILFTADTDMVPAVDHVKYAGKRVEVVVFSKLKMNISQLVNCANGTTKARQSWFRSYPSN